MAEQETVLVYNRESDVWTVYSNVPKHIRRLASIVDIQPVEIGEAGEVVAVRAELTEKQIRFAAPR
jgi:predicted DNA binding protein